MFKLLIKRNINVIHIILTKPILDKTYSALEQIKEKELQDKSLWIGTLLQNENLDQMGVAPVETSIYGDKRVKYYKVDIKNFMNIGRLKDKNSKTIIDLITGECSYLKGIKDISG